MGFLVVLTPPKSCARSWVCTHRLCTFSRTMSGRFPDKRFLCVLFLRARIPDDLRTFPRTLYGRARTFPDVSTTCTDLFGATIVHVARTISRTKKILKKHVVSRTMSGRFMCARFPDALRTLSGRSPDDLRTFARTTKKFDEERTHCLVYRLCALTGCVVQLGAPLRFG